MVGYLSYLYEIGAKIEPIPRQNLAHGALEALRLGAELRSCGTFDSIEEVTSRFSELRGGVQRALLATEYLPGYIIGSISSNMKWQGFVVAVPTNRFLHINQVILVPEEILWKPDRWWALYHEIGHIIVDNFKELLVNEFRNKFMATKTNQNFWLNTLTELITEVIGFEMGFYGDYSLFFDRFWSHIKEINVMQASVIPVEFYALRSFFTYIFLARFRNYDVIPKITEKQFRKDFDFLYRLFIEHLAWVEDALGNKQSLLLEKHYIAAQHVKNLAELYDLASYWSDCLWRLPLSPTMRSKDTRNTKQVVESLNKGHIWWERIDCPQAIIYDLMKDDKLTFGKRMATVLTFWNQRMKQFGLGMKPND
jgi:hypothetical protein